MTKADHAEIFECRDAIIIATILAWVDRGCAYCRISVILCAHHVAAITGCTQSHRVLRHYLERERFRKSIRNCSLIQP